MAHQICALLDVVQRFAWRQVCSYAAEVTQQGNVCTDRCEFTADNQDQQSHAMYRWSEGFPVQPDTSTSKKHTPGLSTLKYKKRQYQADLHKG